MGDYIGGLAAGAANALAGNPVGAVASIIGGLFGGNASQDAARQQYEALQRAARIQEQMYNDQVSRSQPYLNAGNVANNQYLQYLGLGGSPQAANYGMYAQPFSMKNFQQDPGYTFRLGEGLKAINQQFAGRGGIGSGAALKAISNYGQNAASQEYQNAYNRYYNDRNQMLAPLSELTNRGYNASNQLGQFGQNYANAMTDIYSGQGNAQAAGTVGQANAFNQTLQNFGNLARIVGMGF